MVVTGPIILLITHGILPALAARLVEEDVRKAFRGDTRRCVCGEEDSGVEEGGGGRDRREEWSWLELMRWQEASSWEMGLELGRTSRGQIDTQLRLNMAALGGTTTGYPAST